MEAENELYDAGSDLVEAAVRIARAAADPAAAAAIPGLLGCLETALADLGRTCAALQAANVAVDPRSQRLNRGYANLALALTDAADASGATRALAARLVAR